MRKKLMDIACILSFICAFVFTNNITIPANEDQLIPPSPPHIITTNSHGEGGGW
ncbi:hypothetical protein M2277_004813 [Paenibacillus sp. LBL]|jgi:hypothetical protein|nr:hypothetical protein [Paenibacillus sp. LBL]